MLKGKSHYIINEIWNKGFVYQISLLQILSKSIKLYAFEVSIISVMEAVYDVIAF